MVGIAPRKEAVGAPGDRDLVIYQPTGRRNSKKAILFLLSPRVNNLYAFSRG